MKRIYFLIICLTMTKVFPVKAIEVELYQPLIDWDTSPIQAIFIQKSKENIWEVS